MFLLNDRYQHSFSLYNEKLSGRSGLIVYFGLVDCMAGVVLVEA
jgi:hypothetical protein